MKLLLGMESASDKEVWHRAKVDGYVVVTRAAVLKLLLDNKASIVSALETDARASIELIA
jgi:predicted nuclease of predicted toxin-antitoxin system